MSNQGMQFADPERQAQQETDNPHPINTDPREQRQWSEIFPQQEAPYGYQETYPHPEQEWVGGGKLKPKPRKRSRAWLWILIILLIVALSSSFGMRNMHRGFTGPMPVQRFLVANGANPVIQVSDDVGNIRVHVGDANEVLIQANMQNTGFGSEPRVQYNQDNSGVIHATVDGESGFLGSNSVNFDVSVPSNADLQLKTSTGEIEVSGVTGQMSLTADTGSIHANQDILKGSSVLQTNTGSITFDGSLDANGHYLFQADTGTIGVTLPNTPSFHVDATTDTGSISTDFPELTVQHPDVTGANIHGDVGASPNATVTLKTDTGSITLNKQ
jgi:hypothetical protein